jgi:hypothetical protein
MSSLSKLNTHSTYNNDSDSDLSTFITSETNSFPSFLIKKDLAMTSMEYLEEDSIIPPYLDVEDLSPMYQRFNSNVVILSTRNQSGMKINADLINTTLQHFPVVIENKENNQI